MNILQSIVLGIIQGITEFFPISSSGHLVIFPYFFNWGNIPLYFIVTVHFATLASVVTIFYKEIFRIIKAVILGIFIGKQRASGNFKIGIFLIIASIPAAVVGFFLDDYVENLFSKPILAAIFLLATALFLWLGELRGRHIEAGIINRKDSPGDKYSSSGSKEDKEDVLIGEIDLNESSIKKVKFNFFIAAVTGIGQALAILPGISRSGATISFSRFFGIKRSEAVKFSFLLSVPVIFGSFAFELYRSSGIIFENDIGVIQSLATGFLSSYLVGLFAIKFIVYLTRKKNLNVFAIYCICLAAAVFIFFMINKFI